jgi:hypothetical protein
MKERTVYDGMLGEIWTHNPKAASIKTFPFGYLAKGYSIGMVATSQEEAEKMLKRMAITPKAR